MATVIRRITSKSCSREGVWIWVKGKIEKFKETVGMRTFKIGSEDALEILKKCKEYCVFRWMPQLNWLTAPDYIFWLGTSR